MNVNSATIVSINKTKEFGNNGFKKRELVVRTNEQYPQCLSIEFIKDKCDMLDNYKNNDVVNIGINLRGREWVNPEGETKYFNSIQGWMIEKVENTTGAIPEPIKPKTIDDMPF